MCALIVVSFVKRSGGHKSPVTSLQKGKNAMGSGAVNSRYKLGFSEFSNSNAPFLARGSDG